MGHRKHQTPHTRALIAEANRARGRRWHAELAELLADLGELTDKEAAVVVGKDPKTVRTVRDEFGLPGPRSRRNGGGS